MGLRYDALGNNLDIDLIKSYSNNKVSVTSGGVSVPSGGPTLIGTAAGIDPAASRDYDISDLVFDFDFGNSLCYPATGTTPYGDPKVFNDLAGNYDSAGFTGNPVYNTGGYFEFDGVGDTVGPSVSGNVQFNNYYFTQNNSTAKFTMELWVRFITTSNTYMFSVHPATHFNSNSVAEPYFRLGLVDFPGYATWYVLASLGDASNSSAPAGAHYYNNSTIGASGDLNQEVSLNTWKHVILTYDGTNLQLYVNNNKLYDFPRPVATGFPYTTTATRTNLSGVPLSTNASNEFDLAAVRYYDDHFSATRVQNNWNSRKGRFGLS